MTGVEFLPEGHGADHPAHADGASTEREPRTWWVLGAAGFAFIAVLWAVTRPSGTPSTPRPTTPTPPLRTSSAPTTPAAPSDTTARNCHGAPFCAATILFPSDVRRVLQQYLPTRISSLQVRSYLAQSLSTGGTYLADRDIDVAAGSIELLIRVHRIIGPVPGASPIVVAAPGVGSLLIHRHSVAFVIDVQYLAPETVPPVVAKLRELAIDMRLEAL